MTDVASPLTSINPATRRPPFQFSPTVLVLRFPFCLCTMNPSMPFNTSQPAHQALRSVIAEKTTKLVVWAGSGLSAPAGLPTWPQLKTVLLHELREKAAVLSSDSAPKLLDMANRIQNETNYWIAFQLLQQALGISTYRSAIREALRPAATVTCPESYTYVWNLKPAGIVNLNLDRLATKALGEVSPGLLPAEFSGKNVGSYLHALKSPRPFIANLHGIADEASSWVFTYDELRKLRRSPAYNTFLTGCFTATTVLFLGISTDDIAVGGHLQALANAGIDTGSHYWLTDRNDLETNKWAERVGIRVICYSNHDNHAAATEFFEDILHFVPDDDPSAPPVYLQRLLEFSDSLPSEDELLQLSAEEARQILNTHATALLREETVDSYSAYDEFAKTYDQAIYHAWYTSATGRNKKLLGFTLQEEVARGAFGRVYRATTTDGRQVAIKVLLEDIRRDPELLGSFRRGVRSMRYLGSRGVQGMVAYQEASEIPALVVMDWVDGPTLSQAREAGHIDDWDSILKIAIEVTSVIRRAHGIPERVLHRDLRPSNIMFEGFYTQPEDWRVVVLDFDLSWHRDAHEKSVVWGTLTGYLAPEQIKVTAGTSTRHAAVDSFGVGMTLYYLISGTDPMPAQHRHQDWKDVVTQAALGQDTTAWVSLPYRYARVVFRATHDRQANRWDIAQINDELRRLCDAHTSPDDVSSAELLAEEIAARCGREYEWDSNSATAIMRLASGLQVSIAGDETGRQVVSSLGWESSGQEERKKVGKWMKAAAQRCDALFRKAGWQVRVRNIRPPDSVTMEATLPVRQASAGLAAAARVVLEVGNELSFE